MRFKIKVKQVVRPYGTSEFVIDAYNAVMAEHIFSITHPEYDIPEWHIAVEKLREGEVLSKKDETSDENLKKREQQMAQEKKRLVDAIIYRIRKHFNSLIRDEEEAIEKYEYMVETYSVFGWRETFADILKDEREHLEKLRICLQSINEVYEREGDIKPSAYIAG